MMTFTTALELLKNGNEDAAWAVAQMDEGMNPGVTKEAFLAYAERCIEQQKVIDAAYEDAAA